MIQEHKYANVWKQKQICVIELNTSKELLLLIFCISHTSLAMLINTMWSQISLLWLYMVYWQHTHTHPTVNTTEQSTTFHQHTNT